MIALLFTIFHVFNCEHDFEQERFMRELPPKPLVRRTNFITKQEDLPARKPIRVHFDMSSIGNPSLDSSQCKSAGETVIVNGVSRTCLDTDVLTDKKIQIIKGTMENARNYIVRLAEVTPYSKPIDISHLQNNVNPKRTTEENCDLFIAVFARPYGTGSSTLASAGATTFSEGSANDPRDKGRPITGRIQVNPTKLPDNIEDENSGERQFFITCMHELMHILAFSSGLFRFWVDRETLKPYAEPVVEITNKYNLKQTFLSTPKLVDWVNSRFQVVDKNINTLGLELEDGGGGGTAGSHPVERLYFTDIMQGRTYGPGYFSIIYFHTLYDSGWYEPNYTMTEELVFLNSKYMSEYVNQYILTEPPKMSFPASYFCTKPDDSYCFYDYASKANCELQSEGEMVESLLKRGSTPSDVNKTLGWYSPNGGKFGTDDLLDYAPILIPNNANCRDPNLPSVDSDIKSLADKLRENYSVSSVCAVTKIFKGGFGQSLVGQATGCYQARCGEDLKLRMTLPGTKEQLCERGGQKLYPKGSMQYVVCPEPAAACATLPKTKMVTVEGAIPDIGPFDGGNFVELYGFNLYKYKENNLKFFIGTIPLEIVDYRNSSILAMIPKNIADRTRGILTIPQDLVITGDIEPKNTVIEQFYTFVNRKY